MADGTDGSKTIALVKDEPFGSFCCAAWGSILNGTHCTVQTRSSYEPFLLEHGRAIQDRLTGSLIPPATIDSTSVYTQNVTASPSGNCATMAVGVGVGVPLAVLLSLAIVWALYLQRQLKKERMSSRKIAHTAETQARIVGKEEDVQVIPEACDMQLAEMGTVAPTHEMDARNGRWT